MSIIIERMERDPLDLYHVTGADALIAARNMYEAAAKELERGGAYVRHPLAAKYHPATEDEAARLVVWYGSRRLVVRCATDAVPRATTDLVAQIASIRAEQPHASN